MVGAVRLALRNNYGMAARSCALAAVTTAVSERLDRYRRRRDGSGSHADGDTQSDT
jgi:hypothetical protein